ncbi:MAG: UTP--glucose-1-phosphate uridylyltransferase [Paracoccaceae bacterium]
MKSQLRTAIFPVAGLGTRFLPATKATPKELLPVIDTPLIQFAIDEARAAGISRMIFVNHPSKSAIEDYVRHDPTLDRTLRARSKGKLADMLADHALDEDVDVRFAMQDEPLGLGHAVLCAQPHLDGGPVAVVLPDDLILGRPGCLSEMAEAYERARVGHLVAAMEVAPEAVKSYGVLATTGRSGRIERASGMVEKPAPEDAPSRTAVVGRYILAPTIFDALASQTPGAGGEIQLTDAIARRIDEDGLAGYHFSGERFDCGSKAGMLAATLRRAAEDPAYRGVLEDGLADLAAEEGARIAAE